MTAAPLAIYIEACGACREFACNLGVRECSILWRGILEVQTKCLCK
ncbi:MAG: hypothetical protein H0Z19_01270 [Archaeoglobus sp.]|nr:hypothetical protein [Archaeoglobus sp.]MBO8179105.1 hypothetical protein [Archaeoglobus sp.]